MDYAMASSREIVDWFEMRLRGWGPNTAAALLLKKLARWHNNPKLAEGLHDSWRREQIAAIVDEIFNTWDNAGGEDGSIVPAKKPQAPKSGRRAATRSLDDETGS
jgi:hypothetical protein